MKSKLSESARKIIVEEANNLIEKNSSPDREILFECFSRLLLACNSYRGFNYSHWLDTGYTQWVQAGRPEDNTPYLGDQTRVRFY
jgi:hypothetical protein